MSNEPPERMPVKDIISEPGAHELSSSPDMKPYLEVAKAALLHSDPTPELAVIRQLPLEKRYVCAMGYFAYNFIKIHRTLRVTPLWPPE